jgi:hypothetical protein
MQTNPLPAANQRADNVVSLDGKRFNETTGDRLVGASAAHRAYAELVSGLSAANKAAARDGPLPKDFLSALLAQTQRPDSQNSTPQPVSSSIERTLSHPKQMAPFPTEHQWADQVVSAESNRLDATPGERRVEATDARPTAEAHAAQLADLNRDAAWAGSLTSEVIGQLLKSAPRPARWS